MVWLDPTSFVVWYGILYVMMLLTTWNGSYESVYGMVDRNMKCYELAFYSMMQHGILSYVLTWSDNWYVTIWFKIHNDLPVNLIHMS